MGVPNHAPIPLLALYLKARPSLIVSAEAKPIEAGTYVDPASVEVEQDYVLDPRDPHARGIDPTGLHRGALQPLLAHLRALRLTSIARASRRRREGRDGDDQNDPVSKKKDRAPLVEACATDRLSPPVTPDRVLPLRLPDIA